MRKRVISLFVCLSLILAMAPALPLSAFAATNGHTQAEAVAWTNKQIGKYLDYDNAYGAQCVDLIKYYYAYLGNGKYARGNATEYQSNALPSGWTRVKSNPQPGDVIVWGGGTKGSAKWTVDKNGHVGIVVAVNGNKLTTVEQNISGSACKQMNREASYATCFIRPDFASGSGPEADPYPAPQITSGKDYTIVNKASGKLLDVYGNDNSSNNKANVQIYAATGTNTSQRFNLVKTNGGWWSISPLSNRKLAVNPSSDAPQNGTEVVVFTRDTGDNTQGWYFEAVDEEYFVIRNAYNKNIALTAQGKNDKSNVNVANYTGSDYQLWKLFLDGKTPVVTPTEHIHDYTAEVVPATCTESGHTVYTCEACGDSYVDDTVDALGHSYTEGVCTRCGEIDEDYTGEIDDLTGDRLPFEDVQAYPAGTFSDIEGRWYENDVKGVYCLGLMNGVGAGRFAPKDNVTVAQAVAMAARLHNIYYGNGEEFKPFDGGKWYDPYVNYVKKNGLLAENFDYGRPATREEFAHILAAAFPEEALGARRTEIRAFADRAKIVYRADVELLYMAGVINGVEQGGGLYFKPGEPINRAEAAAIVTRMAKPELRVG